MFGIPRELGLCLAVVCAATLANVSVAQFGAPPAEALKRLTEIPTPRSANGKPVLTGYWNGSAAPNPLMSAIFGDGGRIADDEDILVALPARDGDVALFELDQYVMGRTSGHLPLYRPQYWEQVRELDRAGITLDPVFHCQPAGVPRMGAPVRILELENEVILFYSNFYNIYRIIPTDDRPPNRNAYLLGSWLGDSKGYWDGDTFVIDSQYFNDQTWFDGEMSYIHGWDMTVQERIRRQGNVLYWEATVEDPEYLMEPYTLEPQMRFLNTSEYPTINETPACKEKDAEGMYLNIR